MKGEAEAGAGQGPCVQTGAPRGGSLALDPELRGREQLLCGEFSSFLPSRQLAPSGGTVRIKVPRLGHSHTPCRVCDRAAAGRAAHRGGGRPWDAGCGAHPGAAGRGILGAGVAGRGTPGVGCARHPGSAKAPPDPAGACAPVRRLCFPRPRFVLRAAVSGLTLLAHCRSCLLTTDSEAERH